jgi:hypothetical protein
MGEGEDATRHRTTLYSMPLTHTKPGPLNQIHVYNARRRAAGRLRVLMVGI